MKIGHASHNSKLPPPESRTVKKPPQKVVIGEFSEEGYEVQVVSGARIVHSYAAGNHRRDSAQSATPGAQDALRLREIRKLCVRTAREITREHRARYGGVEPQTPTHFF
jgi:hypothetical protein